MIMANATSRECAAMTGALFRMMTTRRGGVRDEAYVQNGATILHSVYSRVGPDPSMRDFLPITTHVVLMSQKHI